MPRPLEINVGYPQQPHDPYQQSGPQYGGQPYQPQPYSQPHLPAPMPQYGPVQMVTVRERGFNPITMIVHGCLWVFVHWWLAILTIGLWLLVAIPVTFIGWKVTRTVPVQQQHQPPPYPPQY
ncbi:hypothetical protein [Nonomuraea roseoviolacea]|uniref:Uncharacterized protein n=1 Tax=Nonomuraea roseoviolacea subsp. carminata TaxID=160689 RepID=A0ABT1KAA1_9ACTN|nr:hypothetical protein [Nonomuraea roseoviolacea]MCP2350607.1 hypothetical protein [Nonomuraea roseoviolacea subsp. carminata]